MIALSQPLSYRMLGTGTRKVLALHCTIGHSGAWRALAEKMSDCTFVAPDMLSHGKSPDWDRQGDYQDRMLDAVLPFLTEPMDVIGHSFGALLALRLTVEHPAQVRSLTMIEPVFFAVAAQDNPDVFDADREQLRPVHEALAKGEDALAARIFNRMWGHTGGPRWDDMPRQMQDAMTRGIHVVGASGPAVMDRPGLLTPGRLDTVSMPSLLLCGSTSPEIARVVNDGLARRLPDARNAVIEGAGHMLPVSHPDETANEIRRLFDRAPRAV